eukprot:GHVT01076502.1.p1 GENE.GHVT01076502.1~~GHVT01076502.1.p1  ORF type:complete len:276 (-),score=9.89 GHVT01076502.1:972-1799(-)
MPRQAAVPSKRLLARKPHKPANELASKPSIHDLVKKLKNRQSINIDLSKPGFVQSHEGESLVEVPSTLPLAKSASPGEDVGSLIIPPANGLQIPNVVPLPSRSRASTESSEERESDISAKFSDTANEHTTYSKPTGDCDKAIVGDLSDAAEEFARRQRQWSRRSSKGAISVPCANAVFPALALWDFGQCDIRKCSGRKLARLGQVKLMRKSQSFHGIVLSPQASRVLSKLDRELIESRGIAAIDCSWNKLEEIPFKKLHKGTPFLIARGGQCCGD